MGILAIHNIKKIMNNLLITEGDMVRVDYVQLPKGNEVHLQPFETKFTEIKNAKVVYFWKIIVKILDWNMN